MLSLQILWWEYFQLIIRCFEVISQNANVMYSFYYFLATTMNFWIISCICMDRNSIIMHTVQLIFHESVCNIRWKCYCFIVGQLIRFTCRKGLWKHKIEGIEYIYFPNKILLTVHIHLLLWRNHCCFISMGEYFFLFHFYMPDL